ncbi:hypothetical protein [Catenovulum sediminis]|uniref:Toxin CptA n=1 Tax=Catenovulum sediminis TaxID=1740262 RepID=A0ABV1RJK6_9ALTE
MLAVFIYTAHFVFFILMICTLHLPDAGLLRLLFIASFATLMGCLAYFAKRQLYQRLPQRFLLLFKKSHGCQLILDGELLNLSRRSFYLGNWFFIRFGSHHASWLLAPDMLNNSEQCRLRRGIKLLRHSGATGTTSS